MSEFKNDTFLARWMNDELSEEELKAFKESSEYSLYMKIRGGTELIDSPEFDENILLEKIKRENRLTIGRPKPNRKLWIYSAAASIVILLAFAFYSIFISSNITTYQTEIGQKLSVVLPDGSQVELNANSHLSFSSDSWETDRTVQLKGEAFFKVTKGNRFIVNTEMGNVSVLGTEFTVQELDGFFQVMCFEGSVKVESGDDEEILKPKRSVRRIRNNRKLLRSSISLRQPSWTQGKSTFASIPLEYVFKEFQNQYNIQFEGIENLENSMYTGGFPHGNVDLALEVFLGSLEVKYEKKGNVILLSN